MPWIKMSKLMKPKDKDFALPNLQLYYWAAQIKNMISWCSERTNSIWYNIEAATCSPLYQLDFYHLLRTIQSL